MCIIDRFFVRKKVVNEDGADVCFEEEGRAVKGKGGDGGGGGRANAWESGEERGIRRKTASVGAGNDLCDALEGEGAAVVTEAVPSLKDGGEWGAREGGETWEGSEETREELPNAGDLSLLKHNF